MKNRLPVYILGLLVLMAVVWRIGNPPAPPTPGPKGSVPMWNSAMANGDMVANAVNPAGTMWAGAWNDKPEVGKLRSAVWIVDFAKSTAASFTMKEGARALGLSWKNDGTVRVLTLIGSGAEVIDVDSAGDKVKTTSFDAEIARVLVWPNKSIRLAGQIGDEDSEPKVALLTDKGKIEGKEVDPAIKSISGIGLSGAISPDGGLFVFSVSEDKIGGNDTYYLVDSKAGTSKRIFNSRELPGRIEGLWVSPAGVFAVCTAREKVYELVYDIATGRLDNVTKTKQAVDIAANWPDAPKSMMFVTYNNGFRYQLASRKSKELFNFKKQDKYSDYWRSQIQDGRLYKRKDGNYTSVSVAANAVDIRVIEKNGDLGDSILARH